MTVYTCPDCHVDTEVKRDGGYPPPVNPRVCPECGQRFGPDLR